MSLWSGTAALAMTAAALVGLPAAHAGETLPNATQVTTLPQPIVPVYSRSTKKVETSSMAGGPGSAAANAAVRAACEGGQPLRDPQWYALPDRNFGALQVVQRGTDRDDADPVPARFAFLDADTLEVLACQAGPVDVPDDTPLLLVAYYRVDLPRCDVRATLACAQPHFDYTLHQVSTAPPANDDIANAIPITSTPFVTTVNTSRATQDGPKRVDWTRCIPNAVNLVETADVWFRYVPAVTGLAQVAVESPYPGYTPFVGITRLTRGAPEPPDPNQQLDDCFSPPVLIAGQVYLIYIQSRYDSYYGEPRPVGGPVTLSVGVEHPVLPPRSVFVVRGSDDTSARLVWLPERGADAAGVTGYRISRDGAGGGSIDVPTGTYSHVFTGLQPWTVYNFTVRPLVGSTPGPAGTTFVFLPGDTPSAPRHVAAAPANHRVTLSWTKPAHPGESEVTGYRIRRYIVPSTTPVQTLTVPADQTSRVFALRNGRAYDFDVTAINAQGTGVVAALPGTVTPAGPAGAPQTVTVTRDERAKTATLHWAPPINDGGAPVTGYQVTRSGLDQNGDGPLTLMVPAGARSVLFENLVPGVRYHLRVAAITSAGLGTPAPNAVTLTTPSVPRDVTAVAGDGTVTLTWSAPRWAGSEPLSTYRIRRFVGASDTQAQNFAVPAGTTSYTFTGLHNGSGYSFDVTASNPTGKGPPSPRTPVVTPGP